MTGLAQRRGRIALRLRDRRSQRSAEPFGAESVQLDTLPVPARGSKESRAHAVAPLLEAGQVRFHHRAAPLVEELPRFPKGTKDLVDAFGHGALWLETRYWRGLGIKRDPLPMLLTR